MNCDKDERHHEHDRNFFVFTSCSLIGEGHRSGKVGCEFNGQHLPGKPTPESQARVKKMYGYDCAMCHGANGNGKGDITDLKPAPKDYTDPAVLKDLSDGELFYLIKNGKGQMPPDGGRTKPDDIWNMVILVRSFAKK